MKPQLDIPEGFRLLPGEELASVQYVDSLTRTDDHTSSIKQMYRLTSASTDSEIGARGPALAALAASESDTLAEHQGLYAVVFGRDSLRVAIDLVRHYPALARSTLITMAELQGTRYNRAREEEPGRIVHEARDPHDPIAERITAERGWGWPYYGSVDATIEFIRTLSAYCRVSDDNLSILFHQFINKDGKKKLIADAFVAAVNWMTARMDQNREGLIEYKSTLPHGIENQVWKDSPDAYHHADGQIANHQKGIASIEVQTVAYDALLDAADLYEHLGKPLVSKLLRRKATKLRRTILTKFWTEDKGGYFVLGTDRDSRGRLRQMKIRTSNMGHILNSHVLENTDSETTRKLNAVMKQLQSPELLAASGIRTLASDEYRYREGAYHNGSVWIWDTHHIAKGIRRHNSNSEWADFADELDRRILEACEIIGGFPEYVRGGDTIAVNDRIIDVLETATQTINRVEQPPQEVQAWTVAAILATKIRHGNRRNDRAAF